MVDVETVEEMLDSSTFGEDDSESEGATTPPQSVISDTEVGPQHSIGHSIRSDTLVLGSPCRYCAGGNSATSSYRLHAHLPPPQELNALRQEVRALQSSVQEVHGVMLVIKEELAAFASDA